jgi:hypothetical protein
MQNVINALRNAIADLVEPLGDRLLALAPLGIPFDPVAVQSENFSPETLATEVFSDLIDSAEAALPENQSLSDWYEAGVRAARFSSREGATEQENQQLAAVFEQLKQAALNHIASSELLTIRPPFLKRFLKVEASLANWYDLASLNWATKTLSASQSSPSPVSETTVVAPWVHRKLWVLEREAHGEVPDVELSPRVKRALTRNLALQGQDGGEHLEARAREIAGVELRARTPESARAFGLANVVETADVLKTQKKLNFDLPAWAAVRDNAMLRLPTVDGTSQRYNITFQYECVYGSRDWMYKPFLGFQQWSMPGYPAQYLSNGSRAQPHGPIALYPIALLIVKNLKISASWSASDKDSIKRGIGFGPFALGGKRFESDTLSIEGSQILGWVCQYAPILPPR